MATHTRRPPAPWARWLEPLAAGLWIWFLVWTLLTATLWLTGWGEVEAGAWVQRKFLSDAQQAANEQSPLQQASGAILRLVDPVWVILAAVVAYARTVRAEGLGAARRWFGVIVLAGFLAMALSVWTGWPLGRVHFTGRLGMKLGPVSIGALLLWPAVVLGARELARLLLPRSGVGPVAAVAGVIAAGTALNLEPLATKLRAFWLWNPGPMVIGAGELWKIGLTWGLLTALLVYALRQPQVARARTAGIPQAAIVVLILNAMCLGAWLTRG